MKDQANFLNLSLSEGKRHGDAYITNLANEYSYSPTPNLSYF